MTVDTEERSHTSASSEQPSSEAPQLAPRVTWRSPRPTRSRRPVFWIGVLVALIAGVSIFMNVFGSDTDTRGTKRPKFNSSGPTVKELRERFTGRYENQAGDFLILHQNGSYDLENYVQTGKLEWWPRSPKRIFVTTYSYTDFAGQTKESGMKFAVKGGDTLIRLNARGVPLKGQQAKTYTRVER